MIRIIDGKGENIENTNNEARLFAWHVLHYLFLCRQIFTQYDIRFL